VPKKKQKRASRNNANRSKLTFKPRKIEKAFAPLSHRCEGGPDSSVGSPPSLRASSAMTDAAGNENLTRFTKLLKNVNSSESHRPEYNDDMRTALVAGVPRVRARARGVSSATPCCCRC
jgi:hypothetical protein